MKYPGKWKAIVFDNNDPDKRCRIKVRGLPFISGPSPWCEPCLPYGGLSDLGFSFIPEIGAGVWVELEAPFTNPNKLIWTGSYISKPFGNSETSESVKGEEDFFSNPAIRGSHTFSTSDGTTFQEPESYNSGEYPNVKSIKTKFGLTMELDDTPGKERMGRFHPGGFLEEVNYTGFCYLKNRGRFEIINGRNITHIVDDNIKVISGINDLTYYRDSTEFYAGNKKVEVKNDIEEISNKRFITVNFLKNEEIKGSYELTVLNNFKSTIGGSKLESISGSSQKFILDNEYSVVTNLSSSATAKKLLIISGDYDIEMLAGNFNVSLALGKINMSAYGGVELSGLLGSLKIT